MSFLKNLFQKDESITSYSEFWEWFGQNERSFRDAIRGRNNIERDFFDKAAPKLAELKDGLFLLTGTSDENTVDLIVTPDGNVKNIVFAEELIAAAPPIAGWKFFAMKPETGEGFVLRMRDVEVSADELRFLPVETWEQPDNIDIRIVHPKCTAENHEAVSHAVFIFLDTYLGEMTFVTDIDNLSVVGPDDAGGETRPVSELKSYLEKRRSEFVEKYEGTRINTDDDEYSLMEGQLDSGLPLIAVINTTLLTWDSKASHPWIAAMRFEYADRDNNGLPGNETYQALGEIEDEILAELKDRDGYLNVLRETGNNERIVYFACRDFRKPSKVLDAVQKKYAKRFSSDIEIYKDKYWATFDRFIPTEGNGPAN